MFSPLEIIQKKQRYQDYQGSKWRKFFAVVIAFVVFSLSWGYFSYFDDLTFLCTIQCEEQKTTFPISFFESGKWKIPFTIEIEKLKKTNIILFIDDKNICNQYAIAFENSDRKISIHVENYQGVMSYLDEMITKQEAEEKTLVLAKKIQEEKAQTIDCLTFASLLENIHNAKTNKVRYQKFVDYSTFLIVKVHEE